MKKRIVCVLLTLIMLMSLVPMTAFAAGMTTSESAITILKQLEGYNSHCTGYKSTYGYGSVCTDSDHEKKTTQVTVTNEDGTEGSVTKDVTYYHGEEAADKALRATLAELDTAINNFAAKKGITLTQGQHDALVLFSFENGTAWTTGTGDLQAAITSRATGSEFLSAICRWDASTSDDNRRMIEANMYLNGVYSSSRPSNFIRVYYYPNYNAYELPKDGEIEEYYGDINGNTYYQYYDVSNKPAPHLVPTMDNHTFTGWYEHTEYGWTKVNNLSAGYHNEWLVAGWVLDYSVPGDSIVSYVITKSQLLSQTVYEYKTAKAEFVAVDKKAASDFYFMENSLWVDSDYLDEDGVRWCRIQGTDYWVKVNYSGYTASSSEVYIDVTVTVTNSYVRSRENATIHSAQNGTYNKGDQLRIINTANADGFLWGQVAASATDDTAIGWVALMYTNWESVKDSETAVINNSNVIATAVISYPGYVNVRSDAGTNNSIVSALPYGTEVNLYETKFVNGLEWGRCSTGWFCLTYANVNRLTSNTTSTSGIGFTSYVFTGTVDPSSVEIYQQPSTSADRIYTRQYIDQTVSVSNFVSADGYTWGKIKEGWIKVTDNATYAPVDVNLSTAKYVVAADGLTVRSAPSTSESRVDTLIKGVEFNVNEKYQILVVGDTIWGYATKVGEDTRTYEGWVNLANSNVTRNGAASTTDETPSTGLMATVINTNSLKVRSTGATYGTQIGTLSMGTTVSVWESNDDCSWYKVDSNQNGTYDYEEDGWVAASYLNVYEGASGSDSSTGTSTGNASVETGMGVVANTYSGVNVRQGAGIGYAAVGKMLPGTAVEILEVTTAGASKWGRTSQGWVCMDYITMVSNYEVAGTTGATGTTNATTSSETAIYTGYTNGAVTVYKEASLSSDAVRNLAAGANVTMHEILTVTEDTTSTTTNNNDGSGSTTTTTKTTSYWARVNDGYIYNPAENLSLDTLNEAVYTVTESESLNVRSGAGTGNGIIHTLDKGDQVKITKLAIVNNSIWGYIESSEVKTVTVDEDGTETVTIWNGEGWVSMSYMTKGAITIATESQTTTNTNTNATNPVVMGNGSSVGGFVTNTSGYRYTAKAIKRDSAAALTVRATPSTSAATTTTLSWGQAMVIYETTTVDGMAWGRCDAGWVYLYYVDLTPVTGAVDARVVATDNTVIYSDMNCSSVAGTYAKQSVIDIYEIVGKMARTELGWVNTDGLL